MGDSVEKSHGSTVFALIFFIKNCHGKGGSPGPSPLSQIATGYPKRTDSMSILDIGTANIVQVIQSVDVSGVFQVH